MNRYALVFLFLSTLSIQAQDKSPKSLKKETLTSQTDSISLSISFPNFVVSIVSIDGKIFTGKIHTSASSYDPGDYKSLYSKTYSAEQHLNSDTAGLVFNFFSDLKVASIPTDKDIKGWRYGTDGIVYTIRYTVGGTKTLKTYWTPSAFNDLPEAIVVNKFIMEIDSLFQFRKRWNKFLSGLPKGKSYRYGSMIIVTVREVEPSSTWIEQITVNYRPADEPPIVGGRPDYTLTFNRNKSDLISSFYAVGDKKIMLEDTTTISPSLVQAILDWSRDRKVFSLRDLDVKEDYIQKTTPQTTRHGLNFPMPNNFMINLDSMSFCKKYTMQKILSNGNDYASVTIHYSDQSQIGFTFDSDRLGLDLNLEEYFICYAILNNPLPYEFPAYKFFSQEKLIDLLYEYQKIIECEGYYYREYISKHPELSPSEKRMMKGWNFAEYLQQRNSQNSTSKN